MGIVIVGAMELCKNFFVPIIPKSHEIIETNLLALLNHELNTVLLSSS
jgi:hypothetical protein